jgi:hypothetical protein
VVGVTQISPGKFDPNPSAGQCSADGGFVGAFSFTAELTNESDSTLSGLGAQVVKLTGGNFLQTGNATAGGKNAYQTISATLAPSTPPDKVSTISMTLAPGARTEVPFLVCLKQLEPFRLSIDVLGTSSKVFLRPPHQRSFELRLDPSESCREEDSRRASIGGSREHGCND